MNLEKYECTVDMQRTLFRFESTGPNGVIKKAVNYVLIPSFGILKGRPVINLAFGDWDEEKNKIDDTKLSNNKDKDKILSTVASTVVLFVEKYGNLPVYAEGNTPAKTRFYQMAINAHWHEIDKLFRVYGFLNREWVEFKPGVNYEAFLGIKK